MTPEDTQNLIRGISEMEDLPLPGQTRHVVMSAKSLEKLRAHPVQPGDRFETPDGSSITAY